MPSVARARRTRRSSEGPTFSVPELSAITLLTAPVLSKLLAAATAVKGGREPKYAWRSIVACLSARGLVRELGLLREARLGVRTSQMWVAGYPRLVDEWHPTKNGELFPDQVSHGSSQRVWWTCPNGPDHEWNAVARSRTTGTGCPCCTGQKVSITNCLATRMPALAAEWHPSLNGALTPRDVVWSSTARVWWKCAAGTDHDWCATVNRRSSNATGCPYCAGLRLSVTNALATAAPELAREWHPTKNGRLSPAEVTLGSSRRVWWRCSRVAAHEWQVTTNDRASHGRGCPFCAKRRVSDDNALATLFPQLTGEWHPTKNGRLSPSEVAHQSHRSVWWRCETDPRHVWRTAVQNRTAKGSGCPKCARLRRGLTRA
jgi:Probable Zinc-ribbon domain